MAEQYENTLRDFCVKRIAETALADLILALSRACAGCSAALRTSIVEKTKAVNQFGDEVLDLDLICDRLIEHELRNCHAVGAFASEEKPFLTTTGREGEGVFTVAFDPLDGSSIIDTNFAVGSIFGIWRGTGLVGQKVKDQVASMIAVYGPRTEIFLGTRATGVHNFILREGGIWHQVSQQPLKVKPKAKFFAPGNLRATTELKWYAETVQQYMDAKTTLRYSGGLVPDAALILVKGSGIFMTPRAPSHKVKLRVCFECGPMSFLLHCAGGAASTGEGDYLELMIDSVDQRSALCIGSKDDVVAYQTQCSAQKQVSQSKL
jgi:sedoheptulose-bisphosphatase